MKDEIKEILDRLDFKEWEVDLYKVPITWCELYDIRDYITNLQTIEQQYSAILSENAELESKITNLQKENKQLKEELENDIDRYEDTASYQLGFDKGKEYLQKENEQLKEALLDIKVLIQHYGNEEKIIDIINEALGDKENE